MFCVIAIVATNAITFEVFPRYVTRTTTLSVPTTITTTSTSTTTSMVTVVSYWTMTMVSTTTMFPYGQYPWWQNPYYPPEATTTVTDWWITTSTQSPTATTSYTITITTTQTTTTSITTSTTTSTAPTTTSTTSIGYIETTLTLSHVFVSGFTGSRRFNGYLRERNTGNPVAGKAIVLTILSGGSGMTFTATTNGQGYYEYLFTANNGVFTWAEARFSGSGLYLPSFSGRVYP